METGIGLTEMVMGLREDMRNEPVAALDLREVITVSRSTRVSEAIALMRQQRLGCVVIVDDENRFLVRLTHPVSPFPIQ